MRRRKSPSFRARGAGSSARRRKRPETCAASAGPCRATEAVFSVRRPSWCRRQVGLRDAGLGVVSLRGKREGRPMKAAVLYEVNKPLVIEDVSISKPGPREVLL